MMKIFHGPGQCCEDVFEAGVDCSAKTIVSGLAFHVRKGLYFQYV